MNYTRSGDRYDFVLDLVARRSIFSYKRALTAKGRFVLVGGSLRSILQVAALGKMIAGPEQTIKVLAQRPNRAEMEELSGLVEAGALTPVIERVYPLEDVADAVNHVGELRALGKIMIRI